MSSPHQTTPTVNWEDRAAVPFSFVYGGKSSRAFLGSWELERTQAAPRGGAAAQTLVFRDPETRLEVRASVVRFADTGGLELTLSLANEGTRDTPVIEGLCALDLAAAPGSKGPVQVHQLHGGSSTREDWLPFSTVLEPGGRAAFGPHGEQANSSSGACPFFDVQWDGGGLVSAIGWSAPWRAVVERAADGGVRLVAGLRSLRLSLHPGESVRGPRILVVPWSGADPVEGRNAFRRHMLAHVLPRRGGAPVLPPVAHTSVLFREESACTEADVLSYLEAVKDCGFEVFWLDAYWIRDGYPKGTGHYGFPIRRVEPPDRFPRGLRPIGEAAHRSGMEFLVWFSPEIVWAGSELEAEGHPWARFWKGEKPLPDWGQVDLGVPEAREFMTRYVLEAIGEYGIDWLRIDSGMIEAYAREKDAQAPDRAGLTEIRYVEGLYRMWDEIRAARPGLAIDNCFGGGRRIDLETCARALPLWRTDITYDPAKAGNSLDVAILNQSMTAGLNRYVPFSLCASIGIAPYFFRSGFNGGIVFSDDCRQPGYPLDQLRAAIDEARRIRRYWVGDFYPLLPVTTSPGDWCAYQHHLPGEQAGMVMVFRRHEAAAATMRLALHGIDAGADYEVARSSGYAPSPPLRLKGADVQSLAVRIVDQPGSQLIEYRRAP